MSINRISVLAFVGFVLFAPSIAAQSTSFVNFESGHVRPLALSPSGNLLLAVNTPDNRLEVFQATSEGLESAADVRVGLEPVAVVARTETEAYVVNHLSDDVSVVDLTDPGQPFVKETLLTGDEPRDIVIANDRIFVTTARRGQHRPGDPQLTTPGVGRADVWVWDATDLSTQPDIVTLFSDTPRALAVSPDGTRVYAAAFTSGNKTTVINENSVSIEPLVNAVINDGFISPGMPAPTQNIQGVDAPVTGLILKWDGAAWRDAIGRDWSPRVRLQLPDYDVFSIDAMQDPPMELDRISGVGTVLFNMTVHPTSGDVYVTNIEARNDVRFEPELSGHSVENNVTIIPTGGDSVGGGFSTPQIVHLNPHIDFSTSFGPASEIAQSLALPLQPLFSSDGTKLYVVAFGSEKVGVLTDSGAVQTRITVGGGPSGLALDESRERLYVMNRFDHTISIVNTVSEMETAQIPLAYNPEPAAIVEGRPLLYDATNSGHGDSACASCHIFGDTDHLTWDLGDPDGLVESNPIPRVSVQGGEPLRKFHPMKGAMATQSLRGMDGAGAMHWRGDRNGGFAAPFNERLAFMTFLPAFQSLLGKETSLPVSEMEKFRDFILTLRYPPNPIANIDGTLTPIQAAGRQIFDGNGDRTGLGGDGDPCVSCHTDPIGTGGQGSFEGESQDFKVAHMRNLYQKIGMYGYALPNSLNQNGPLPTFEPTPTPATGDQIRGFGFGHDGSIPTLFNFFRVPTQAFTFENDMGRSGNQKVREMEAFLLTFPTGLAPVVGQQVTMTQANFTATEPQFELLQERAFAGDGDLIVHGLYFGSLRGFLFLDELDIDPPVFASDVASVLVNVGELTAAIQAGSAVLTATVVPRGNGFRIALDRDDDGWHDGDEARLGSNPASSNSIPPTSILRGDCNGDGGLDISDAVWLLLALFAGGDQPTCDAACDSDENSSLNVADAIWKLQFLFSSGPPPGAYPVCEVVTASCRSGQCSN